MRKSDSELPTALSTCVACATVTAAGRPCLRVCVSCVKRPACAHLIGHQVTAAPLGAQLHLRSARYQQRCSAKYQAASRVRRPHLLLGPLCRHVTVPPAVFAQAVLPFGLIRSRHDLSRPVSQNPRGPGRHLTAPCLYVVSRSNAEGVSKRGCSAATRVCPKRCGAHDVAFGAGGRPHRLQLCPVCPHHPAPAARPGGVASRADPGTRCRV